MEEQVYSIGPLMKAARKFKKYNQADVAKAIGCSQSALSKMEHNLLVPSAPQWFLFARFTSIPPETLETGVIDRRSKVKLNNDEVSLGFKIPKRYRHFRAEKVREIYPFLTFIEKKLGPEKLKKFMDQTELDSEFFLDFDNLINFQLYLDVVKFLIDEGLNDPAHIKEMVDIGQNDVYWNHYGIKLRKFDSPETLLEDFAEEQVFFQTDFQLKVDSNTGKIIISYFPEYHLKQVAASASSEAVEFINLYRAATLENLVKRCLGKEAKVQLMQETHSSPLGARFEINVA